MSTMYMPNNARFSSPKFLSAIPNTVLTSFRGVYLSLLHPQHNKNVPAVLLSGKPRQIQESKVRFLEDGLEMPLTLQLMRTAHVLRRCEGKRVVSNTDLNVSYWDEKKRIKLNHPVLPAWSILTGIVSENYDTLTGKFKHGDDTIIISGGTYFSFPDNNGLVIGDVVQVSLEEHGIVNATLVAFDGDNDVVVQFEEPIGDHSFDGLSPHKTCSIFPKSSLIGY